jgi:hypothetical protein
VVSVKRKGLASWISRFYIGKDASVV